MAKAGFVTTLIALSIALTAGYDKECARGAQYWCQSFATANDCGAVRHCTDTVWKNDEDPSKLLSTTSCEWCRKILDNAYTSIQRLANSNEMIKSKVASGCRLFPLASLSTKCTDALEQYGEAVTTLMKAHRYGTLCHLMEICVAEPTPSTTEEAPETEKLVIVGSHRCTWGPAYWCSSLSNARECGSTDHCSTEIWSQQSLEKKPNDKVCQYCEYTINKLRDILAGNQTEMTVEKWLAGACSMLPSKELIDGCISTMSKYAEEVLVLIRANVEPGIICQLAQMCKEATIKARVTTTPVEKEPADIPVDEESKMLCHVIVQATHELAVVQQKNRNEVQVFLNGDCQNLAKPELVQKCDSLVHRYGHDIYGHVTSNVELSKICDHLDDFTDHTAAAGLPPVHCELCRFVLSTVKYMLDAKQPDDKMLTYIDEQVCSRLPAGLKTACRAIVLDNGKALLEDIRSGSNPMLLCTRFQVCLDQVFERSSPISKDDLHGFIKKNICNQLGTFQEACSAMFDQDATRLLKTLVQDLEGDTLCAISGICPQKMSFFDNLAINDDKNKCQRCIDDFTRRKHIAEKLVNHSAEFLHHLCEQLPEKDQCKKAVDDSINELVTFVRSLDPQDICVQLKMCDKTMLATIKPAELTASNDLISQEVIAYIKTEVCTKLGALEALCKKTIEMEGPAILADMAKQIDPKLACKTIGVCASESAFSNCNDKCDCCMGQVEVHEVRIATFLRSMAGNIRTVCNHMPSSAKCLQMTNQFDENINRITSKFNAKRACELLNHCSATPVEIETLPQCQKRIESKRQFLLNAITTVNQNLKSLCEYIPWNKDCYTIIDRSTLDVEDVLKNLNNETVCVSGQSLAEQVCRSNSPFGSLCKQLVTFDGDHTRLEALFKSMFNQNGNVDMSLCELDADSSASSNCVPSADLKDCQDKCDCCVQFYTTKKNYDLSMIETMRSGLLATCDWSLTKDYCLSWFNRVCDRMKAKEEQFVPTTFCKRVGLCPIEATTTTANAIVDKCQTCTSRLTTNQQRFRSMVDDLTATLLSLCTDADCRSLVQSAQQKTIDQISKIDSQKLCQRYGYCAPEHSSDTIGHHSRLLGNPYHHIGSSIEALDLRLETALSSDLCFQYGQLRPMCEHLLASAQGRRYANVYKALMKGDTKFVDDDLREQLQTKPGTAVCDACKNAVQSGKDFWINSLDVVHNVMLQACERCPKKDECKAFYDQRFERLKTYINSIDANLFCQSVHLCNSQSMIIADELDQCTTCINFFDQRKENLEQGVTRLVSYLKDLCQRYNLQQCDVVLQGLENSILPMIKNFQSKEICNQIGFCSLSDDNGAMSFENYRKAIEGELEEKICNSLGPFASLCKQMQTGKINDNIRDLLHIGEDKTSVNLLSAANQAECARDGCQCCINRIEDKKKCLTNLANQVFDVLIKSCDYCPSKGSCRQYWTNEQGQCVSSIKTIDSKQICTKLGFCNVSSLCAKMNLFQDECERLLAQFAQSSSVIEQHLPHTSVVIVPTDEKKSEVEQVQNSNATCILCEYFMHIVTSYIGQNSTEEEIEQSLNKICQQMPKALASQCEEFVENYAPVIVATLMQDLDATTVCRRLNLCTKQMTVNLSHLTKADPAACGVCDYMTTYVRFTLNRDPSGKSIPAALAYVCAHLSDQQKPQCQTLVQLFGSRMKELKLDLGDNFCQHLAICEAPKREGLVHVPLKKEEDDYKRTIVKNLDETPECTICHYVISYLDAALKNNKSEEAFEAALEKVCKILPTKERAQCNDFIKSYGPVLAELIAEMADPDLVCRYLGLCQVSSPMKVIGGGTHDYQHLPVQDAPFTCTICQYIISRMKHFVTLNQTEEEILASLKESCDLFSVLNLQQQCRTFLNDYGQFIIQMVASDVDPKVACQSMGICAKNQAAPATSFSSSSKTDYTKCIFGMSYWCTSRQNAELCNAVEICETQVWSKKNKNIII